MKSTSSIKFSQKSSQIYREISALIVQEKMNNKALQNVLINRVTLSKDKGICFVYFYVPDKTKLKESLDTLICYKPSLRKALADSIKARYTPDIIFRYDETFEKQQHIENILNSIAEPRTGYIDPNDVINDQNDE